MFKYIFTIFLICILLPVLATAADSGGNGSKAGEYYIHNGNNYWVTVFDRVYEGTKFGGDPSGEYPGGSGNEFLYVSYPSIGVRLGLDIWVNSGGFEVDSEFRPEGPFYSPDTSWHSGIPQYGDFDTSIYCEDAYATERGPIPIFIRAQTWSFTDPTLDDCIGFKYVVYNDSDNTFDEVYFSYRADFDIGSQADNDLLGCDVGSELAYIYDSGSDPGHFGVTCGTGDWVDTGFFISTADNEVSSDEMEFGLMQGYSWTAQTTPDDYRIHFVFEIDPMDFEPGETFVVGFYQVAGMTLAELQTNADAARASYIEDEPPLGVKNIKSASLGTIKAIFK